ncbi:GntR family transcriptional regulator [Caulobacter sp. FWC26]|uniref:GntR family transcriptional regulator n=1 Tax=Caulobacter sp. FWC26 TaxID=69665 RepID=UPI000C14F5BA|nr:GntR family transcriptional regulator [Caulobacter sp. FWC26]AZS19245.1 GntR family transcriptional regulator [Caulobacter sp. FWC26]
MADIGRSAVLRALPVLRDIILRLPAGAFIGSETELIARIGVSAPTLRQAARLLEHEELLVIRRGVGGGFFGRRPSAETVARSAALFLNLQNTPIEEVYSAAQAINAEVLKRAALSDNDAERARLGEMLEEWRGSEESLGRDAFIVVAERLTDQMASLAGNAPLALFLRVFRYISLSEPGVLSRYDSNREEWKTAYIALAQAVFDRDARAAIAAAERLSGLAASSVESTDR